MASKIKNKKLVYDSHEYFTEVPELQNKNLIKKIWINIEKFILPKIKYSYTVCDSIASIYNKKYGVKMQTVRNIPEQNTNENISSRTKKIIHSDKKIIIYQGALNIGRGIENMIEAMKYIKNAVFVIIGSGDIEKKLQDKTKKLGLNKKVIFVGQVPFSELHDYTVQADIGISIEKNIGLNYYYSLPNKLFDYINANIPVLVSELPETKKIVEKYQIGELINSHNPKHIAEKINSILNSPEKIYFYKKNLKKASKELC